jgi:two-component system response regulator FixJ
MTLARICLLLTPREIDIVEAVIAGETMKETARRLGLSPRTVEVYRLRAHKRLGARTPGELVRIALRGE